MHSSRNRPRTALACVSLACLLAPACRRHTEPASAHQAPVAPAHNERTALLRHTPAPPPGEPAARAALAPEAGRAAVVNRGIVVPFGGASESGDFSGAFGGVGLGSIGELGHGRIGTGYGGGGLAARSARERGSVRGRMEGGPGSTATEAPAAPATPALTAATVADADRFGDYLEFLSRHDDERHALGVRLDRRLHLRVLDPSGRPVHDARITVQAGGGETAGRSHADGYWDYFHDVRGPAALRVVAERDGARTEAAVQLTGNRDQSATLTLAAPTPNARVLDLGFALDVTASMGDELTYLTREIDGIVRRVQRAAPGVRVRVGAALYRDRGDPVPLRRVAFTEDVAAFASALREEQASGGNDYPEDLNAGLAAAMNDLSWTESGAVRVLVLIADAPPQAYPDERYTWRTAMSDAARRGIRILPVAASGADRRTEYLFRALGVATSTPYVYLTNDSGIGGPHLAADTPHVEVEGFADAVTRLVSSDLVGEGMHAPPARTRAHAALTPAHAPATPGG